MKDKIRWGIIGPGIIAHEFAHDFQFVENGTLTAVASRSDERGQDFANRYGIPKVYNDYEELYHDPEIDAIYIATPHTFHLEQSCAAMVNGKAVLCEKPITINPPQLETLLNRARGTNQYLIEGMWTYFLPAIVQARQWVAEGRIGAIHHVKADFGYPVPFDPKSRMYNPELSGGTLLDMGIYSIAMAHLFIKEAPKDMKVYSHRASTGVDDDVTMLFQYEDALATLACSFRCKLNNWAYIIGEEGTIAIPDFWRAKEAFLYHIEECVKHYVDPREGFGFEYEIRGVSDELLHGKKESGVVSHETSLQLQHYMADVAKQFN